MLDASYEVDIWYDELTEINSDTILYDEIGNPVQLSDCNLVWTEGRQLAAVTYTENNQTVTLLSYTYDENGIRTSKTYEGITTYYTTEDGRITSQYQLDGSGNKTEEIIFIYNKSGELIAAEYSGKTYYYAKNVMGDVCAVVDDTGAQIVSYNYYAFGSSVSNINTSATSSDRHFAAINPMQYRSYYWDADLGAYYLQSRYYAPNWCRFINADIPEIAEMSKNCIAGINLFAYCSNDPVNNSDPTGKAMINIILAAIFAIVGGLIGRYLAKKLPHDIKHYKQKYYALIALSAAIGAIIGWFSGTLITKLVASYLKSHPEVIFKLVSRFSVTKYYAAMKFLGINPFTLAQGSSKFIAIARLFNSKSVTIGVAWAEKIRQQATKYGYKIYVDKPHNGWGYHIHFTGGNGKLNNIHIQITKAAYEAIKKLIGR